MSLESAINSLGEIDQMPAGDSLCLPGGRLDHATGEEYGEWADEREEEKSERPPDYIALITEWGKDKGCQRSKPGIFWDCPFMGKCRHHRESRIINVYECIARIALEVYKGWTFWQTSKQSAPMDTIPRSEHLRLLAIEKAAREWAAKPDRFVWCPDYGEEPRILEEYMAAEESLRALVRGER